MKRIVAEITKLHLLENPGLIVLGGLGSADTHSYLAGGVASEYRTVLDKDYLGTVPCCGNSSTHSCEPAADNHKVSFELSGVFDCRVLLGPHFLSREGQGDR